MITDEELNKMERWVERGEANYSEVVDLFESVKEAKALMREAIAAENFFALTQVIAKMQKALKE